MAWRNRPFRKQWLFLERNGSFYTEMTHFTHTYMISQRYDQFRKKLTHSTRKWFIPNKEYKFFPHKNQLKFCFNHRKLVHMWLLWMFLNGISLELWTCRIQLKPVHTFACLRRFNSMISLITIHFVHMIYISILISIIPYEHHCVKSVHFMWCISCN